MVCLQIWVVGVTRVDIPSPGEHIDLLGESARSMVDVKVEGAEEFGPTSLSAVEVSLFEKVLKVFVVGKDLDAMAGAFQVVAPVLEGLYDGEKLLVVDVVVAFGFCHRLRTVGDRVPEAIGMFLGDHTTSSVAGCVNFNASGERRVPDGENRLRSESGP